MWSSPVRLGLPSAPSAAVSPTGQPSNWARWPPRRRSARAAQAVALGDADIVVAGGMESMSCAPFLLSKARYGYRMGNDALIDAMILEGLWCAFENHHMGMWAENIATEFEVSRRDQDELAAASHQRAARAR